MMVSAGTRKLFLCVCYSNKMISASEIGSLVISQI